MSYVKKDACGERIKAGATRWFPTGMFKSPSLKLICNMGGDDIMALQLDSRSHNDDQGAEAMSY